MICPPHKSTNETKSHASHPRSEIVQEVSMNEPSCCSPSLSKCSRALLLFAALITVLFVQVPRSIAQSLDDESFEAQVEPQQQDPQGNAPQTAPRDADGNFFERLGHFYMADWHGTAASGPAPQRRALDAPLDSPPYPSSDWG